MGDEGMDKSYSAEFVVCGAGTAGSVAAIAAADQGLDVILIDQFGCAGGSATLSLVTPMMSSKIEGNPQCSYIGAEINRRMEALGAQVGKVWFDPEMLKFVLEEMLTERGVKRLYHTVICGAEKENGKVTSVIAANKSGIAVIEGKVFLDATGDADLCACLELPLLHGNEEDGANQPMSLRYILGGVNLDAFWKQIAIASGTPADDARPENFDGAVTNTFGANYPLRPLFLKAVENGDLLPEDAAYWQFFTIPGRADGLALNCPEFFDIHDADDADNLTRVQVDGKHAILRQLAFYRKYLSGFEKAYIAAAAPMVGVRESRRAITEHMLTIEECVGHARFPDAICRTNYHVDVHGKTLKNLNLPGWDVNAPYYEIPLRSLIVKDVDNLMVAGRDLGSEFVAQSSARIIPTCRAMGEAAGIAAGMVIHSGSQKCASIDGADVRRIMMMYGAEFDTAE